MKAWLSKPLPFGMWLATCLVIGLLFAGGLLLYDQVKSNRVSSIEQLCLHDNANARNNVDFLERDLHSDPRVIALAKRRFRQTRDCHAFAVNTIEAR